MGVTRAVCLISGGLDSCVAAAVAHAAGCELSFLHLSYGQRTETREQECFHAIAEHYQVQDRIVVRLPHLHTIGGSALTDPQISLPSGDLHRRGIPISYVPFRNANFLAAAVSLAEVRRASRIYIGAVEEDSSGYPDCRESFFEAFNLVIRLGTRPETQIHIETPLLHLSKAEIVRKGMGLGAPLGQTWSCYQGVEKACGDCDSCLLRLRGFALAGLEDPIDYARRPSRKELVGT